MRGKISKRKITTSKKQITAHEIYYLAKQAQKEFPYKVKDIEYLLMGKPEFLEFLENSFITKDHEEEAEKTPAFIARLKSRKTIVFCEEIINNITKRFSREKQEKFIKAITIHELFHFINNHSIENEYEALKSEEEVHQEFRQEFPDYFELLEDIAENLK